MMIDPIISKNVALIKDANGKDIERIYDKYGNLVFKNWNTLEGPFPIGCFTSSNKLRNYRIYGNTIQDGTPTPEDPVDVQGCGERTENLFDVGNATNGASLSPDDGSLRTESAYNTSDFIDVNGSVYYTLSLVSVFTRSYRAVRFAYYDDERNFISSYTPTAFKDGKKVFRIQTPANTKYIRFSYIGISSELEDRDIMFVLGSTAPSVYIPYGYKIPVVVTNGTNTVTTPIYIGSEPLHKIGDYADYIDFKRGVVVRRIKKLVLTGNEQYDGPYAGNNNNRICFSIGISDVLASTNLLLVYNSHFRIHTSSQDSVAMKDAYTFRNGWGTKVVWFFIPRAWFSGEISEENCERELRAFFATQYSAGTPVTIWYVLAEPEEEVLPLSQKIPTNIGSNIFSCTISPAPSKAMIQYKKK